MGIQKLGMANVFVTISGGFYFGVKKQLVFKIPEVFNKKFCNFIFL